MAIPFFSSHAKKDIAVVDVGSGSVGVALMEPAGGSFNVRSASRTPFGLERPDDGQLISAVMAGIRGAGKGALDALSRSGAARPIGEVYVILRSPWCDSSTERAEQEFTTDTKLTGGAIAALAQKALQQAAPSGPGRTLLEATVLRVELNGYPTAKPEGKLAKLVALYVLASWCKAELRSGIERELGTLFPGAVTHWRSGARALARVVGDLGVRAEDYVIVDVEGEGTDFCVIRSGMLREHAVSPLGSRAMLEKISPHGLPQDTLLAIKHVVAETCDDAACKTVAESLGREEPRFVSVFAEAIAKGLPQEKLPNAVVLVAQSELTPWLTRFFERIDFAQFTSTMQPFTAAGLTEKDLEQCIGNEQPLLRDLGLEIAVALVTIEKKSS